LSICTKNLTKLSQTDPNTRMPRTRADDSRKTAGGKAPRKAMATPSASVASPGSSKGKPKETGGSNPVVLRPTPDWQKPLDGFFIKSPSRKEKGKEEEENKKEDMEEDENKEKMEEEQNKKEETEKEETEKEETEKEENKENEKMEEEEKKEENVKEMEENEKENEGTSVTKKLQPSPTQEELMESGPSGSKTEFQSNGMISDDED